MVVKEGQLGLWNAWWMGQICTRNLGCTRELNDIYFTNYVHTTIQSFKISVTNNKIRSNLVWYNFFISAQIKHLPPCVKMRCVRLFSYKLTIYPLFTLHRLLLFTVDEVSGPAPLLAWSSATAVNNCSVRRHNNPCFTYSHFVVSVSWLLSRIAFILMSS